MALHFLRLPLPPHSHSSLPFSKSNPPTKLSSSPSPSSKLLSSNFNPNISLFAIRANNSPAAATVEEGNKEEAKGSAEIYDRRRLIAQNIPWSCTPDDVRALFEKHGTVLDVELSMYNKTRNRGLAFITMSSEEEATVALTHLNSYEFDGRNIKVDYSRSAKKKPAEAETPTKRYNVYVGNLAYRVRSQDLRELFEASGKVLSADVIYQSKPRRPAGYGFVSYASKNEAMAAITSLNGKEFMGRPLCLGLSKLQTEDIGRITNEVEESGEESNEANMNGELTN